jgi:hypothetical protein
MPRIIELTDSKAFRIAGMTAGGEKYVRIQQMYKKKGQEEWQFGYQGVSLPKEQLDDFLKALKFYATSEKAKFPVVEDRKTKSTETKKRKAK